MSAVVKLGFLKRQLGYICTCLLFWHQILTILQCLMSFIMALFFSNTVWELEVERYPNLVLYIFATKNLNLWMLWSSWIIGGRICFILSCHLDWLKKAKYPYWPILTYNNCLLTFCLVIWKTSENNWFSKRLLTPDCINLPGF